MSAAETLNTAKPLAVFQTGHNSYFIREADFSYDKPLERHRNIALLSYESPFSKYYAELFAEAGTVAHEIGLTPRQLAQTLEAEQRNSSAQFDQISALTSQRNELLETLRKTIETTGRPTREEWLSSEAFENAKSVYEKSCAVLAKAQQEGVAS